jgi:hypothetical protein
MFPTNWKVVESLQWAERRYIPRAWMAETLFAKIMDGLVDQEHGWLRHYFAKIMDGWDIIAKIMDGTVDQEHGWLRHYLPRSWMAQYRLRRPSAPLANLYNYFLQWMKLRLNAFELYRLHVRLERCILMAEGYFNSIQISPSHAEPGGIPLPLWWQGNLVGVHRLFRA